MTPEQLQAIRERAEKATKGPWGFFPEEQKEVLLKRTHYLVGSLRLAADGRGRGVAIVFSPSDEEGSEANADFIAHACEDIPALLAEVERLEKDLRSSRDADLLAMSEASRLKALAQQLAEALMAEHGSGVESQEALMAYEAAMGEKP